MKITGLFEEILEEQVANKKLFNALMDKWRIEKPNINDTEGERLFFRFQEIKNGLNPRLPQVSSFLNRFDGQFGYSVFPPENLKDITKYSYKQIKSLIDEYTPLEELEAEEVETVFDPKNTAATPEKIQASKDLWFGDRYCVINLDGFRVYQIPDQSTSIKFGYYYQQIYAIWNPYSDSYWCVTRRKDSGLTNLWGTYRGDTYGRTFYFVIDESKSPDKVKDSNIARYYLSALQFTTQNASKYVLTSAKNDGDVAKSWSDIVSIYPQLSEYKDVIKPISYSDKELQERNLMSQITETPGPYEFRRQEKAAKKAYVVGGGTLSKPQSWAAMDNELKALYVNSTVRDSIITRFGYYSLLSEIRKSGNDTSLLNNRIKALGINTGIGFLFDYLIKNDYKIGRPSKENQMIRLYISKTDGNFGIFNTDRGDWYQKEGITYEPKYKKTKTTAMIDDKNKPYIVETYSYQSEDSPSTFYAIIPHEGGLNASAYFLTQKAYQQLTEKMSEMDARGRKVTTVKDFEPSSDIDIKENEKGVK